MASGGLRPLGNNRFGASFEVATLGVWEFAVEGWVDAFTTWRLGTQKKLEAGQEVASELISGGILLRACAARASADHDGDAATLRASAETLEDVALPPLRRFAAASAAPAVEAAGRHPNRVDAARTAPYRVVVNPPRARFSAWYEMFPRSAGPPGQHGTLRDCARRLPYVAEMGFDVLYLPPIHPIGHSYRKGPNNALEAGPDDVGSPWAIGSSEGGHKAVHPALGHARRRPRPRARRARKLGIDVAIDIALQASPDHPYVHEHPEWFRHRARRVNPVRGEPPEEVPGRVPLRLRVRCVGEPLAGAREHLPLLVRAGNSRLPGRQPSYQAPPLLAVVHWPGQGALPRGHLPRRGVHPPQVDVRAGQGGLQPIVYVLRVAAFQVGVHRVRARPRPGARRRFLPAQLLAEHTRYLAGTFCSTEGGPRFMQRLLLAATLSSNYGIYGPPFELMEHVARSGAEEYVDSEKYQLRAWDIERADSLRDIIALVNRIRRRQPRAAGQLESTFHPTDSEQLLAFSKRSADRRERRARRSVNLDVHARPRRGTWSSTSQALGLRAGRGVSGPRSPGRRPVPVGRRRAYVELDPGVMPAAIFAGPPPVRTEQDFDYFHEGRREKSRDVSRSCSPASRARAEARGSTGGLRRRAAVVSREERACSPRPRSSEVRCAAASRRSVTLDRRARLRYEEGEPTRIRPARSRGCGATPAITSPRRGRSSSSAPSTWRASAAPVARRCARGGGSALEGAYGLVARAAAVRVRRTRASRFAAIGGGFGDAPGAAGISRDPSRPNRAIRASSSASRAVLKVVPKARGRRVRPTSRWGSI